MPSFLRAHLGARRLLSAGPASCTCSCTSRSCSWSCSRSTRTATSVSGQASRRTGSATRSDDSQYTSALETSLKIALLSSLFATILGTAAALALARMRKAARAPFDVLVYLTLVVPEIVIAVASLIFFVQAHQRVGRLIPGLGWIDDHARPRGVQHLARHADRAGALRRHGLDARGGELRPRRRRRSRRSGRSRCRASCPPSWPASC